MSAKVSERSESVSVTVSHSVLRRTAHGLENRMLESETVRLVGQTAGERANRQMKGRKKTESYGIRPYDYCFIKARRPELPVLDGRLLSRPHKDALYSEKKEKTGKWARCKNPTA